MKDQKFNDAVQAVVAADPRFHPDAYFFLQEALRFTVEEIDSGEGSVRHVSAVELLDGFRRYALNEFGPMAVAVLEDWGVNKTGDVGTMVFNLIEAGIFAGADDDRPEDFADVYTFAEVFEKPFHPAPRGRTPSRAPERQLDPKPQPEPPQA